MLICQPNSDRSKSIYNLDLVESIRTDFVLFSQYESGLGRFLSNERYLMTPSDAGFVDVKYLESIVRNVKHMGTPLPIPKEEIPCFGGLVFVPTRDLTYLEAMDEIKAYIEKVGNRRVYISELAEELQIDMDLIEVILNDIRRTSGFDGYV
ncbi:MAG: hypothetical protein NTU95_00070 [Methanothrix sp.]|nr:hypothetical protein [Methanothrix sp.]